MTEAVLHDKIANCNLIWKLHKNCNEMFEKSDYTVLLSVVVVVAVSVNTKLYDFATSCFPSCYFAAF